jgi:hypothetical protein
MPVCGERRRVFPRNGLRSASPSGAGGGSGRGFGLGSDLLGAAANPVLTPFVRGGGSALSRWSCSDPAAVSSPGAFSGDGLVGDRLRVKVALCSLGGRLRRWGGCLSGLFRDTGGRFGGDCDSRLSRISGLKRDMLDLVGEANDGRCRRGDDPSPSLGASRVGEDGPDRRGDVRRLLGEEPSIPVSNAGL